MILRWSNLSTLGQIIGNFLWDTWRWLAGRERKNMSFLEFLCYDINKKIQYRVLPMYLSLVLRKEKLKVWLWRILGPFWNYFLGKHGAKQTREYMTKGRLLIDFSLLIVTSLNWCPSSAISKSLWITLWKIILSVHGIHIILFRDVKRLKLLNNPRYWRTHTSPDFRMVLCKRNSNPHPRSYIYLMM